VTGEPDQPSLFDALGAAPPPEKEDAAPASRRRAARGDAPVAEQPPLDAAPPPAEPAPTEHDDGASPAGAAGPVGAADGHVTPLAAGAGTDAPAPARSGPPSADATGRAQETLDAQVFAIDQPLPTGVAVLEASAGTGKTFTIAGLAARYVAEGLPLEQLLVVTFTRMATGELRERVRERLVRSERTLAAVVAGATPDGLDDVDRVLADGSPEEVAARRDRLSRAIAEFDAATLTTIHGFCLEALDSLGFIGDVERDCRFVEDPGDLVEQVVGDLYLRRFHVHRPDDDPPGRWPPLKLDDARRIAVAAIEHPDAVIVPSPDDPDPHAAMRSRLAHAARRELERRKRASAILTYDDLLTRLAAALEGPGGEDVAARLRDRYRVVLVDEFQDTDPIQWSIMRRAFVHDGGTLVLIGDPKQAIYAFRGADVFAYLQAARTAGSTRTLRTNHRSDGALLRALERLFRSARLGHDEIVFRHVEAAAGRERPRLHGAPRPSPLRIRVLDRAAIEQTPRGFAQADAARRAIADDLADDVVGLLAARATIEDRPGVERPVRPGDVAVLVRRNADAERVRTSLDAAGVPAVIAGAGSVFATPSARDWLTLLEALERPNAPTRARAVALTPFLGWSAERVALAPDEAWEALHDRLHGWAATLRDAGVAALEQQITVGERLPGRVLRREDGERTLTDLRHIGQQLHAAAAGDHLGVAALVVWLRRRIAEAAREGDEERSRRLESDAAAVQVLTIHRSKGLEFPIVYCPSLWEGSWLDDKPHPILFHDPDRDARHTLDVSMTSGPDETPHGRHEAAEGRGEDLRLAYVALTRARHQAIVWWAGSYASREAPLSRLAFDQRGDGFVPTHGTATPTDLDARERFGALGGQETAGGPDDPPLIAVEVARPPRRPRRWEPDRDETAALAAARFDRTLDDAWRRSSYSSIVAAAHEAPAVGSEPELGLVDDEVEPPAEDEAIAAAPPHAHGAGSSGAAASAHAGRADDGAAGAEPADGDPLHAASPMADLPGGRHFGTLVHDVFEAADFAAGDLDAELTEHVERAIARRRLDVGDPQRLVAALEGVLTTPLGPLVDDLALRDLRREDRLDELTFELPLVGGDRPTGALRPAAIGALLREHLPAGDPLHGYAERLEDPLLATALRGHLNGSIDLALRLRGEDGRARYAIVDYKTNRLGDPDRPPTAWDHRPEVLTAEMHRTHYALQGLLYGAALHRFLRWRDPAYDPDRDLVGILYLFVRGMSGPGTPRIDGVPCGVWSWRPPAGLVAALSDLLDEAAG